MKAINKKILLAAAFLAFSQFLPAQDGSVSSEPDVSAASSDEASSGFFTKPHWMENVWLEMKEGFAFAKVTRIQSESERSNFVWQDSMAGAFFTVSTQELPFLDFSLRLEAFYPFLHTFNDMEQFPKQVVLYAFDGFFGPVFEWNLFRHFNFNLTTGAHFMYQLSDEYHLLYLGAGAILGLDFPFARRWTVTLDGSFTWDNANAGSNRLVQPYDYSWQWGAALGIKYSKRHPNWQ